MEPDGLPMVEIVGAQEGAGDPPAPRPGGDFRISPGKGQDGGRDGAIVLDGAVKLIVPGHGEMTLDDYVAFSLARLVGPRLANVLADMIEEDGGPEAAVRIRALAQKAKQPPEGDQ